MPTASWILVSLLLLASLGCPPHPLDPRTEDPSPAPTPTNHSTRCWLDRTMLAEGGLSGVWAHRAGGYDYALAGGSTGLVICAYHATSVVHRIPGPVNPEGWTQRDVETYGTHAYVCAQAQGARSGVQVLDLSPLPAAPQLRHTFQPQDGNPAAINLSIDPARGLFYLQRASGVEIWDLAGDPVHPAYLGRVDTGGPVSDLVAQGTRLYVAEGEAKAFSVWDLAEPQAPRRLLRLEARAFAQCIWPQENGTVFATLEEHAPAPLRLWQVSGGGEAVALGSWTLDGRTLGSGLKFMGARLGVAMGEAGFILLDLSDLSHPTVHARYDGPIPGGEPALRRVWDLVAPGTPPGAPSRFWLTDRDKGLLSVQVY